MKDNCGGTTNDQHGPCSMAHEMPLKVQIFSAICSTADSLADQPMPADESNNLQSASLLEEPMAHTHTVALDPLCASVYLF